MASKKRILVAPLNWGLGHATRCVPIINALLDHNFEPILASDGLALELLKKEFPQLAALELPGYGVTYAKKGRWFKLKFIKNMPKLAKAIKSERVATKEIVETFKIDGIISDNRLGVHSKKVPCVFMTHQLIVLSGSTTWLSTKLHQKFIHKFNECWVPDNAGVPNLSGKLGHANGFDMPLKYLGPISRFQKKELKPKYKLMVLISGPEPQRTMLEEKLLAELDGYPDPVLFVKGRIQKEQIREVKGTLESCNFMTSKQLETAINQSAMVICRSGYTTVMDLAKLGKKAFFIPTPGQFEQEYLAKLLEKQKLAPFCNQDEFTLDHLRLVENYDGLSGVYCDINHKTLFRLFKSE